jgi:peptidyl-tRNA hydrolase, PTH1 family
MNISGPSIANVFRNSVAFTHSQKDKLSTLVTISDSLDHAPCTISTRFGGSANGHNGLKSLIAALGGTSGFCRIRAGIGRGTDVAGWVLGRLSGHERMFWEEGEGLDEVERALEEIALKASQGT